MLVPAAVGFAPGKLGLVIAVGFVRVAVSVDRTVLPAIGLLLPAAVMEAVAVAAVEVVVELVEPPG